NTNILDNPITQAAIKMLKVANYRVIDTQSKELACQSVGNGAMAEPLDIFWHSAQELLKEEFWSGKMASSLAAALFLKGADVNLIATRFETGLPKSMHTIEVESSDEMLDYLVDSIRIAKKGKMSKPSLMHDEPMKLIQKTPYLFMAAAVSDYIPAYPQEGKIKKTDIGETWNLELRQNIDILDSVDKDGIKTVAFKAEMDSANALKNASSIIDSKSVDAVCLNLLADSSSFGTSDNQIDFITAGEVISLEKADKLTLSLNLLEKAKTV
ncbi:MAG: phosphopantothenoylcysteine decarboxylase, partial [Helicobacteraceae bacterium 4484_230]